MKIGFVGLGIMGRPMAVNLLKAGLNSAFILALYKPLVTALRKTGLLPKKESRSGGSKAGLYIFAAGLLITCILLVLVLQGKL